MVFNGRAIIQCYQGGNFFTEVSIQALTTHRGVVLLFTVNTDITNNRVSSSLDIRFTTFTTVNIIIAVNYRSVGDTFFTSKKCPAPIPA